jgi:hypothetical protein
MEHVKVVFIFADPTFIDDIIHSTYTFVQTHGASRLCSLGPYNETDMVIDRG